LINPNYALFSVTLVNIWHGTAFSMLLQYAGLQRIPFELYEAARVDGAGAFQSFRYITLPQLRPVLFINLVLISIYTFNAFDIPHHQHTYASISVLPTGPRRRHGRYAALDQSDHDADLLPLNSV